MPHDCTIGWIDTDGNPTHHQCRGGKRPDAPAVARVYLPGYVATIDGRRVTQQESGPFPICAEHLAEGLTAGIFSPGVVSPTHSPDLHWRILAPLD